MWYSYCFPDWTYQQLPPLSFKCWKRMLSVTIFSAFLSTCVLHTRVQLKGGKVTKTREIPLILKIKKITHLSPGMGSEVSLSMQKVTIFYVICPRSFKPSPNSFGWLQLPWWLPELQPGANSGLSSHAYPQPCHMLILPHWGFFWRQRTTQHQTLRKFLLKENINSWTPPRDLDKVQSG